MAFSKPVATPRPRGLWTFNTKNAFFFLDRPSSPCSNKATQFRSLILPSLAFSKMGCSGKWTWNFFHQASQMSPSRVAFGLTSPARMCIQLFSRRKFIQSLSRRKGTFKEGSLLSTKVFGIGNAKRYFFAINRWQSLSPFVGARLETSSNPSDLAAVSDCPKSETTSRAVRMIAAQAASANKKKIGGEKLWVMKVGMQE